MQNNNSLTDLTFLQVNATVRYWDAAIVNGVRDNEDGTNIPCKSGNNWSPLIHIESGQILNWSIGVTASVYYKVCDCGQYDLLDSQKEVLKKINGYVPSIMYPKEDGFGDYIIMDIDENGYIKDWRKQ